MDVVKHLSEIQMNCYGPLKSTGRRTQPFRDRHDDRDIYIDIGLLVKNDRVTFLIRQATRGLKLSVLFLIINKFQSYFT